LGARSGSGSTTGKLLVRVAEPPLPVT